MFNRIELKTRAKSVLKRYYWKILAIAVIVSLVSTLAGRFSPANIKTSNLLLTSTIRSVLFLSAVAGKYVIFILLSIFILKPLNLAINKASYDASKGVCSIETSLKFPFKDVWANIVKVLFCRDLFLFLFAIVPFALLAVSLASVDVTLLAGYGIHIPDYRQFLPEILTNLSPLKSALLTLFAYIATIPLLIKIYDYRMVEYILVENPTIKSFDALRKSKQIMRGNRWATLVLDLSFIGWYALGVILFGFGSIFVIPYHETTNAQLYLELTGKTVIDYVS